ncbi:hypothetical protein BDQ17DRAFT_921141 [Cyathus striatus]|nr:hypothetical protein BDQ17DRAFT_921141 [Cyathus striatus]
MDCIHASCATTLYLEGKTSHLVPEQAAPFLLYSPLNHLHNMTLMDLRQGSVPAQRIHVFHISKTTLSDILSHGSSSPVYMGTLEGDDVDSRYVVAEQLYVLYIHHRSWWTLPSASITTYSSQERGLNNGDNMAPQRSPIVCGTDPAAATTGIIRELHSAHGACWR